MYWSSLGELNWFPFEKCDTILIIGRAAASLSPIFPDGTEKWKHSGVEVCPIYLKDSESRAMTQQFAKSSWLRNIDSGKDFYEFLSLKVRTDLLNRRRSPQLPVDSREVAIVVTNNVEPYVDDMQATDDDKRQWVSYDSYS